MAKGAVELQKVTNLALARGNDADFVSRGATEDWPAIFAFRDQPGFCDAVMVYAEIMAPFFAHNFVLNKVVTEAWRFQMLVFALHLHQTRDPADPHSGLTISNFRAICARQEIASGGRAAAYINIMQLGGYLTRVRSPQHRRIVHYEPTPMFMATVEQWNEGIFRTIDTACSDEGLQGRRREYPGLGAEMRRRSAERLLAGWKPLAPFPEVEHFMVSDGGWMLITGIISEVLRTGGARPVALDLDALGKRAGVSRSHLRRLLEAAHKTRLLTEPPRNGAQVAPSPLLVDAFLTWLASYLSNFRLRALEAWVDREAAGTA